MSDQVDILMITLAEVRNFHSEFNSFRSEDQDWKQDVGQRLSAVETSVASGLTGAASNPSRLRVVEVDVEELKTTRWKSVGATTVLGALVGAIAANFWKILAIIHLVPLATK